MIGYLLNENSLMYTAPTEMIYEQADINDSTHHSFPENPDIGVLLASYTWSDDSLLFLGLEDEELKEVALRECSFMGSRPGICAQGWW
ncbi:hypothetical protein NHX12_014393 [Muraenolepis orangiensis]|uniref:Uncharacterized protein n=1 Tax=Muraenolepis orangiensis TaxID=630683 RepID=A0A9Q0DC11_9TELE|nr:hypothetical protein NHX12_014393 [Muraenolepis orangiensis]